MVVREKGEGYLAEFLDVRYVKRNEQRIGHIQTNVHTGDHFTNIRSKKHLVIHAHTCFKCKADSVDIMTIARTVSQFREAKTYVTTNSTNPT